MAKFSNSKSRGSNYSKEKSSGPWKGDTGLSTRNLRANDLGSVIFGCKHYTLAECLNKKLFGLPDGHFSYVKKVNPGLFLFLFNYSDRTLHGIFVSTSVGQRNIDSHAWSSSEGTDITPYAAQVKVKVLKQCRPLHEEEFAPLIALNYHEKKLFWFELDKEQTSNLTKLFLSSSPSPQKNLTYEVPRSPRSAFKERPITNTMKPQESNEYNSPTLINTNPLSPDKKWSDLFKPSSCLSEVKNENGFQIQRVNASSYVSSSQDMKKPVLSKARPGSVDSIKHIWDRKADIGSGQRDDVSKSKCMVAKVSGESVLEDIKKRLLISSLTGNYNSHVVEAGHIDHTQSFEYSPVVIKLIEEIEGLKFSQMNQWVKFDCLERDVRKVSGYGLNHLKEEVVMYQPKVPDVPQIVDPSAAAFEDPFVHRKISDMEAGIDALEKKMKTVYLILVFLVFILILKF